MKFWCKISFLVVSGSFRTVPELKNGYYVGDQDKKYGKYIFILFGLNMAAKNIMQQSYPRIQDEVDPYYGFLDDSQLVPHIHKIKKTS